jgi:thioesterase domain-containing protein
MLPNDLQAETYYDMDRAAWESLRETATSMPWRMVDARGVQQAAACIGQGTPTVVYIDGWDAPAAEHWSLAAAQQAESNRVCMFDRPGMGLSPARRGAAPHSTPEQHAQEMFDMLAVVGETGPFILVPWSYGGLVARAAATQRPDQVAGMVLVDASSPLQEGWDEPLQGEDGIVDADTITSTIGVGPKMGNRPVIVLQAGIEDPETPPEFVTQWRDLQRQAATISANSLHTVVDGSDHAIPIRNPAAVVAATSAVAESVRAGNASLPACPDDLAAAGVTCKGA